MYSDRTGIRTKTTPDKTFQAKDPLTNRGVQYVHWVMHKCITVKVGGKNTRKVCKKQVNLPKTGGNLEK